MFKRVQKFVDQTTCTITSL